MNSIADLELLAVGPYTPEQLAVVWHEGPAVMRGPEAEAYLAERWGGAVAEARAAGRELFNAPITRMLSFELAAEGSGRPPLTLHLAPTDYRTFLITCYREQAWFLAHAPQMMAPALGNSVLLTHADQALLGVRSARVAAYAGRAHVFGGVLDYLKPGARTTGGVLAHLRRELEEELGLGAADLPGDPSVLALVRDTRLAQPEVIWQWEVPGELAEVAARLERAEHDAHVLFPRGGGELELLTPVARAAVGLWADG